MLQTVAYALQSDYVVMYVPRGTWRGNYQSSSHPAPD
jgi:hypothetical protein